MDVCDQDGHRLQQVPSLLVSAAVRWTLRMKRTYPQPVAALEDSHSNDSAHLTRGGLNHAQRCVLGWRPVRNPLDLSGLDIVRHVQQQPLHTESLQHMRYVSCTSALCISAAQNSTVTDSTPLPR